ncbi:MAG: Transcriptional regulator yidN, Cro/CI family [Anaerocolumna sp.]|jgi:transcriptional regulator with XRE-family HTH domain|nr:Transcriptional regulator yidN, Cro/CI family [Anaerocolumna sp.]
MNEIKQIIAERMKSIRQSKNLSLDQAAEITETSKAMLSQIERGQSIPTITTLWKISTGYKVPITYFMEEEKNNYTLTDFMGSEPVFADNRKMRLHQLFPYNPAQNIEMLYIEFEPDCIHHSEKHMNGVEEYVFVLSGSLLLSLGQETVPVYEKQAFRFRADVAHSYSNTSEKLCTIINIIYYPPAISVAKHELK